VYPSKNGVNGYYNIFKFKKDKITTFPELLQKAGYYTSYDIIDDSVIPSQGFDEKNVFDEETVNFKERHVDMIKELSTKKKFFLFLHYTEIHKHLVDAVIQKYKHESIDDEYFNKQEENNARFNSYVPHCDDYIKAIIQALNDLKINDKTIIILFSDHGTSIGEKKGEKFYGVFVYDYTINVFCMLKIPNAEKKVINKQCRTIDIFPTILDLAKISKESIHELQGKSLISFLENPNEEERDIFVETGGLYGPWPSPDKHNVFCIKSNGKKLIYNETPKTWEFYDLKSDPEELNNIYDENLEIIHLYKKKLFYYFKNNEIELNF
jgi:arylsulfatase A-like enzyme